MGYSAKSAAAVIAVACGVVGTVGNGGEVAAGIVGESSYGFRACAGVLSGNRGYLTGAVAYIVYPVAVGILNITQHTVGKVADVILLVFDGIVCAALSESEAQTILIFIH